MNEIALELQISQRILQIHAGNVTIFMSRFLYKGVSGCDNEKAGINTWNSSMNAKLTEFIQGM